MHHSPAGRETICNPHSRDQTTLVSGVVPSGALSIRDLQTCTSRTIDKRRGRGKWSGSRDYFNLQIIPCFARFVYILKKDGFVAGGTGQVSVIKALHA